MIPSGAFDLNLKKSASLFQVLSLWFGKIEENFLRLPSSLKNFPFYPSLYVLGAFPAWLKVLSRNFGAVIPKRPKNVRDSVPLSLNKLDSVMFCSMCRSLCYVPGMVNPNHCKV